MTKALSNADLRLRPSISVIILNYNGLRWVERCLESLQHQTVFPLIEIIVADNQSTDGSDKMAAKLVENLPNAIFLQHGQNLGYCLGNNRAASKAQADFLLFLNNDTWLEPDCLERLLSETKLSGAGASGPIILNYEDSSFQSMGAFGFDIFGLTSTRRVAAKTREVLMPEGCA